MIKTTNINPFVLLVYSSDHYLSTLKKDLVENEIFMFNECESNNSSLNSSGAKFYAKKAHFEKKYQSLCNKIPFDRFLSDSAKILLIALNGILSTTPGWIPVQSDLERRLNFGPKKMRSAIKSAVKCGYLKVRQKRGEKGKFHSNEFEFDMEAGFDRDENIFDDDPPCDPKGHAVDAGELPPQQSWTDRPQRHAAKEPIPCSRTKPCLKEQQQQTEEVVVVLSDSEKENRDALKRFDIPTDLLKKWLKLPVLEIQNAIAAFDQYCEKNHVDNVIGLLNSMITKKAKANIPPKKREEQSEENLKKLIEKNREEAKNFEFAFSGLFNQTCSMKIFANEIEIKYMHFKINSCVRISFSDPEMKNLMNAYFKDFHKKDV